jgi:hypothetical protein
MRTSLLLRSALPLLGFALTSAPAFADDPPPPAAEPAAEASEEDDLEIDVVAPKPPPSTVSTVVAGEQARKLPGTQGDTLRVVESMPGVARSTAGSGKLVVWGAAPEETRIYIDGVPVPRLYHDGGFRSVVHPDFVRSVELVPGAYGAPYGRGLGGIVKVETANDGDDKFHGSLGADFLDAGGSIRVPLGKQVTVTLGGRRGYLDALLPLVTSEDVGLLVPIPRYGDAHARIRYAPSAAESVELSGILSTDTLDRSAPDADPARARTESRSLDFFRVWGRYRKDLAGGATVNVTPFIGTDATRVQSQFGETPTYLKTHALTYGLRTAWTSALERFVSLTIGLDAEGTSTNLERSGSVTTPPREGDIRVFGQPPSDGVNGDTWSTTNLGLAAFAEADFSLFGNALHITPGLRIDPTFRSVSRRTPVEGQTPQIGAFQQDVSVEPRLAVRWAVNSRFEVKAAAGLFKRPALPEDASAVFGNPLLPPARAAHVLVGTSLKVTPTLTFETTAFASSLTDLAVRNPSATPLLAEALLAEGAGGAHGVQFSLRQELSARFMGWVSYTLSRSERQDHPDARVRAFDYDQTHVFTAVGSYDLGGGFDLGGRLRMSTGNPRTPITSASYDTRRDVWSPAFGVQNTERIGAFFQLDVRLSKRFELGSSKLDLYLDVQNVTNAQNPEEIVYSPNYRQKGNIVGLPILPVLGARYAW